MAPRSTRWIAALCVYGIAVVLAHWLLTRAQDPHVFWDTSAYLEEAKQPFSLGQFFYPKPIFVSLVLRVIGTDASRIASFQQWLSVVSWLCFTGVLMASLETTRARVVALIAGAIVVLDPFRLGYGSAILSESINDSELALLAAALVLLCSRERIRGRTPWIVATTLLATCWMLTRDTNAVVTLIGIPIALVLWRPSPRGHVRELVALGFAAVVAVFVLWSTNVRPGNTNLTFQSGWPEELRARVTYSMMNNLVDRVEPDPAARQFFVEHGLPQTELLIGPWAEVDGRILFDPALAAVRHWISTDARHVWLLWLLSSPWQRIEDQWEHGWQLLGVANDEHATYKPKHWAKHQLFAIRRLSSMHAVVGLLLLALPGLLYVSRRHRLMRMIPPMIVGGWFASLAAMYGDSAEIGRHCYGSGQLIVLGLVMALVVGVEISARRSPGSASLRSGSPWTVIAAMRCEPFRSMSAVSPRPMRRLTSTCCCSPFA